MSLSVASAQTSPQTSGDQTAPSTRSGSSDTSQQTTGTERRSDSNRSTNTAQRVTMTGCLMHGTDARNAGWTLSNASPAASSSSSSPATSRSGSPSNDGRSAGGNRNGETGGGVSGSTSTGTSGARTRTTRDTEAQGAGVTGSTDQRGSTVGAGATAGATGNTSTGQSSTAGTSARGTTYRLEGVKNPDQYKNKRVEVVGTTEANSAANQMLRVTSVRAIEGSCP